MTIPEMTPVEPERWWTRKRILIIAAIVAMIGLLLYVCVAFLGNSWGNSLKANAAEKGAKPTSSASPSPTATSDCPAEFAQTTIDRTGNRFDANGVTDDKATLKLIGHDAVSLAAAAGSFKLEIPNGSLVTNDKSCLSEQGKELYYGLKAIMTAAGTKVNNTDLVPSSWTNSGVSDGQWVFSDSPGINGDRSATSWTWTRDGVTYVVYVMHRCGNWPAPTPPAGHPTGPTDNPPPPTIEQKVPSQDPYPQGNAPIGGGVNADPGPGTYDPPSQVTQPPAAPRENPAPPAPVVPAPQPSNPAPVPTPDPAPAPSPEPSAPTPTNPVQTCTPPPGMTTC